MTEENLVDLLRESVAVSRSLFLRLAAVENWLDDIDEDDIARLRRWKLSR